MICVVINGSNHGEINEQIQKALQQNADLLEVRFDYLMDFSIEELLKICADLRVLTTPKIFTLRTLYQGGHFKESEERRQSILLAISIAGAPDYVDLEADSNEKFILAFREKFPQIKLILSYHDFTKTPSEQTIQQIFSSMLTKNGDLYKLAFMSNSTLDTLRLMQFTIKNSKKHELITISMGELGMPSRIVGKILGSKITYATITCDKKNASAPGQLPIKTLLDQYHYASLDRQTAIYALIGDPVDKSISDKTHNALFRELKLNAVYIKFKVLTKELEAVLTLLKELPLYGLSVTMPHKETIMQYLDTIDAHAVKIVAVNTICIRQQQQFHGFNCDGLGALDAISETLSNSCKGEQLLLLGAGGAARAIAYEARQQGAVVTIISRTFSKANAIAEDFGCMAKRWEELNALDFKNYKILVNTIPSLEILFDQSLLSPSTIVFDIISNPKETPLLMLSRSRGCPVIYGYQMFALQALYQFKAWFPTLEVDWMNARLRALQLAKAALL
ncbi:MAG: shikimate dehydrogenase [Oligoflexia bacterium]|nr:shikimate dehydrogenase [Oligoflexia bacterium]